MNFIKKILIYYPLFWLGYTIFKWNNRTFKYSYKSLRKLFVLTNGRFNDRMSNKISDQYPPYQLREMKGVLGDLNDAKINTVIENLQKNGYYIFDAVLSEKTINEITHYAENTEAMLIPPHEDGTKISIYDRQNIKSPRYQFSEVDNINSTIIQNITSDPSLFAIAQAYLKCQPIHSSTAIWWSAAYKKEASSEAAQLYHFDMDRFKFIKFFFYLTDVNTDNGPHCYVRGSHTFLPKLVRKDGRISDEEIQKSFPSKDVLEITGAKGTILAVDTRGLHKGKVLAKGERLLLQVEFANSLFGSPFNSINLTENVAPQFREMMTAYKHSFQRFKS